MDAEPYPGPTHHASLPEIFQAFRAVTQELSLTTAQFNARIKEVWDAYKTAMGGYSNIGPKRIGKPVYDSDYDNSLFFDPSWGEEQRRKHALLCRKHSNTGPTAEWGFHRDGRKT